MHSPSSPPRIGSGAFRMSVIPPAESGPDLDRRIARRIDGPRSLGEPPPRSTDDSAADALLERLGETGITVTLENDGDFWYCVFRAPRPFDAVPERIASGSAPIRPLAICRAVLNLPLSGSGKRLRLRAATRGWVADEATAGRPLAIVWTAAGEAENGSSPSDFDGQSEGNERAPIAVKG